MQITRKEFLRLVGAGAASLGLLPSSVRALQEKPFQKKVKAGQAGDIKCIKSTCGLCASHCALFAFVKDGRLVKLEGNAEDQQGGGKLCGKGNAGISLLYDPDRLKYPLKRTNPQKGIGIDPKWKRISWDEAFDIVSKNLLEVKNNFGAKNIMWLGYHKGVDFLRAIGSPNDLCHHTKCNSSRVVGNKVVFGERYLIPDFPESKYILAFGWDMAGKAKNVMARPFAEGIAKGAKAVVFEPRLSTTASMAAEWIPIRPGTDIAVALAMIQHIISTELYDKEFVRKNVYGFEELWPAVKEYTPEWASKISDVPAETIKRIAREFATTKPACLPHYKRGVHVMRREGFYLVQAENILSAITGNIEVRGGMIIPRKPSLVGNKPELEPPEMETFLRIDGAEKFPLLNPHPLSGDGVIQSLAEGILNEKPYPIKAAIVYNQGLFAFSNPARVVKALSKIPFMVNINIYPDEMATLADIVLPEVTYLERSEIVARTLNALYPQVSVMQPLVKPLYEAKELGEIKSELAKRMKIEKYMPIQGEEAINHQLKYLKTTYKAMQESGMHTTKKRFKPKDLTKLSTPSGKIEIYSNSLAKHGYPPLPIFKEEWILQPTEEFPFYFTTDRSPLNVHARTENIPWIHELVPENRVWINTVKAKERDIQTGDMVCVESAHGKIQLKAMVTEGIRPDTICVPHGYGHWSKFLTRTVYHGANDGELMADIPLEKMVEINDPSANAADADILVKVYKV
ncbi:MAG: molybdopterin-dependent oxidoreductase [Deltaproteobacteria bacterium]|nr:molybdopterin-dependent oxidoreductase [Deltaproteobacteria bacterium]